MIIIKYKFIKKSIILRFLNLFSYPLFCLMFFIYFLVGAIILYFIYGMRNSNLQHDQSIDDAPDIG